MPTTDPDPSPALTDGSLVSVSATSATHSWDDRHDHLPSHLNYDRTLTTALSHLLDHLVQPLAPHYPPATLHTLLDELRAGLTERFAATWDEAHPQVGSGSRSLICTRWKGLPGPMRAVGGGVGVEERVWRRAIATAGGREGRPDKGDEWEVWCDPGQVVWRWGGWEWEDPGFEPFKVIREPLQVIWQAATDTEQTSPATPAKVAAQSFTPARPSHAIPIRAPTVLAVPPSTASNDSADKNEARQVDVKSDLLPAFPALGLGQAPGAGGRAQQASGWSNSDAPSSRSTSMAYSDASVDDAEHMRSVSVSYHAEHGEHTEHGEARPSSRGSHRGSESQSSVSSSVSDANSGHTQLLLTPASRPSTADPFGVPLLPIKEDADAGKGAEGRQPAPTGLVMPRGRAADALGALAELDTRPQQQATGATPNTPTTESTITPRVPTPSVTPYDGGNVTVLGGGVKLGGGGGGGSAGAAGPGSRASSAHSTHRNPIDRSRSPSISLASRALNTALGPGSESRKQRTRRRIMPTYLGHVGQPGVGGPVMGVFGQFAANASPNGGGVGVGVHGYGHGMGGVMGYPQHVGVGVAPPPIPRGAIPRMG